MAQNGIFPLLHKFYGKKIKRPKTLYLATEKVNCICMNYN